jgi:hypothetical protein
MGSRPGHPQDPARQRLTRRWTELPAGPGLRLAWVIKVNAGGSRPGTDALRRMTLAAAVLVVIQVAIGMVVNLYVTVPAQHPGAHPANYFSGSFHSVIWAIGSGAISLAVHGALGLALILFAIAVAVRAVRLRTGWVAVSSVLAVMLAVGAGFNGASFLDFGGKNISSLLMALLALRIREPKYDAGMGCCAGCRPRQVARDRRDDREARDSCRYQGGLSGGDVARLGAACRS